MDRLENMTWGSPLWDDLVPMPGDLCQVRFEVYGGHSSHDHEFVGMYLGKVELLDPGAYRDPWKILFSHPDHGIVDMSDGARFLLAGLSHTVCDARFKVLSTLEVDET